MKWPVLRCPYCEGILRNTDVYPRHAIPCPTCGAKLQPSLRQGYLSGVIALCCTVAACYLVGLSGFWLILATVLFWFPVFVIWEFIFVRIAKPRFEAFDPPNDVISLGLQDDSSATPTGQNSGQSERD